MNEKLTQDELQAIKEREEMASSGPWKLTIARDGNFAISNEGSPEYVATYLYERDAEFIAAARQDIPKLVAEVERLQSVLFHERVDADHAATHIDYLQSEIERLQAEVHEHSAHNGQLIATHVIPTKEENKRLRKALEFYADKANYGVYTDATNNCPTTNTLMDDGHIAREALK